MGMSVGAFEESEPFGLAAYRHAPNTRIPPQAIARNLVTFYEAWEKADPGKGHGAKAEPFRARVEP